MVDESVTLNDQKTPNDGPQTSPTAGARKEPELVVQGDEKSNRQRARFIYATGARPLEGFTIKRGIGIGGFGQVYYAVSDAGKEVALKHIQRNLDVELRGVGQCLNLKHPNLLSLYDIRYDEAGEGWVVMEYVTGESLVDVIERNPNGMPHDQISFWLSGIAAGTGCLHDHGIVHRDLKPGNIFNDSGIIKIGDYGLSKFISLSRRSAQTESVGTFHYMAPEIGNGRYGKEIDVYALGVISYEMLTGDVPFDGESSQEIIMKHLTAQPKLDHVPEPYRNAIAQALEKDPEKRLSSVPEMLKLIGIELQPLGATSAVAPTTEPAKPESEPEKDPHVGPTVDRADDIVDAELHEEETLFIDDTPPPKRVQEIEFGPVEHRLNSSPAPARSYTLAPAEQEQRPLPNEPIARFAAKGWRAVANWFSNPNISNVLKVIVAVAVIVAGTGLLFANHRIVIGVLAIAAAYGIYYAARMIIITMLDEEQADDSEATGRAKRWQAQVREDITSRPWAQRLSELTGSFLFSAAVAGVLSIVIMILAGEPMSGPYQAWAPQLAWVALSAIGGTWAVLALSKLWEGRTGDHVLRRIGMLAVGLAIGLLAYGVDVALYADVAFGNVRSANELWASWHEGNQPSLVAYLAYFGGLFAILRWWIQADPLRNARLSLWALVLSGMWGFVIPFPQPWGIMLAMAISLAVQLSAPWISTGERGRLRQQIRLRDARA